MADAVNWEQFRQGKEAAFTLLYQEYAPVLFQYGCKLSPDRDLVKDCLQMVFLNVWKNRQQLPDPPSVLHYLLKAIRNEILKKTKDQSRFASFPEETALEVTSSFETQWIDLQTEESRNEKIQQVLRRMPARQREVIFLKYYRNLPYQEIAGIMGIEQDSVYKLTYKAIEKLQQLLLLGLLLLLPAGG
ncbi:MAG: RNA polymerase sigma factor [Adhaeribacter sp.]